MIRVFEVLKLVYIYSSFLVYVVFTAAYQLLKAPVMPLLKRTNYSLWKTTCGFIVISILGKTVLASIALMAFGIHPERVVDVCGYIVSIFMFVAGREIAISEEPKKSKPSEIQA